MHKALQSSVRVLAVIVLCFDAWVFGVLVAPSKTWCKTSSTSAAQKKYALYPSGTCAVCEFGVYGPNHCFEWGGQVCPRGPTYTTVSKNGYRYCVCNKGWYGSPKADKTAPEVVFGGTGDAGCQWCDIFATTTSGVNASSLLGCDACLGEAQFYGEGPFCVWDPVKFALPNCTLPVPWDTPGSVKLPGKGGCGCQAGYFGSWPDCRPCPIGLTSTTGSGLKCTCDKKQGFLPTHGSPSKCTCDNTNGYYATFQNATACVTCKNITGGKVVKGVDGVLRCGCDGAKGYGLNPAPKGQPICLKCSSIVGGVLHKPSSTCRCKKGYGLQAGPVGQVICVLCGGTGVKVDASGFCSCASGYARSRFADQPDCLPCNQDNKRPILYPELREPVCSCKPNYQGFILYATDTCTACSPGQVTDSSKPSPFDRTSRDDFCRCPDLNTVFNDGSCACKPGYVVDPKTKLCKISAACKASKWTGRFWDSSKIGKWNGTFFPSFLLDKNVPPSKTVTYTSLGLTFQSPADIPVKTPFAAVFDIVLWGKKGSPLWLKQGQGRYVSSSRLMAKWSNSYFAGGNFVFTPVFGVKEPFVQDLGRVASYGDGCTVLRLAWWGVKGKVTLKTRIVRIQGGLGTWY